MDMFIDRWGSFNFSNNEIDIVCDAIENLLFKDFFESENTLLSIHCSEENDDEMDRVIFCRNKVDPEIEQLGYTFAFRSFDDFYAEVYDYPVPQTFSSTIQIQDTTIYINMIGIKFSSGYVFMFALANNLLDLQNSCTSMFGLMLTVCKMLGRRDVSAKVLANILENDDIKNLEKTTQNLICEKVEKLLENHP